MVSNERRALLISFIEDEGMKPSEARSLLRIPTRTGQRIVERRRDTGRVTKNHPPGAPPLLGEDEIAILSSFIDEHPAVFLDELKDFIAVIFQRTVSLSSVFNYVHRAGYSIKRIDHRSMERSSVRRSEFAQRVMPMDARHFVFMDEAGWNEATPFRRYAWSRMGERAVLDIPDRGTNKTLLLAINSRGVVLWMLVEKAANNLHLDLFLRHLVSRSNIATGENTKIVLDNGTIHTAARFQDMMQIAGTELLFLPPYSPDFNPIELCFSWMKRWCIRNRARYHDLDSLIAACVQALTERPEMFYNWFLEPGLYSFRSSS